jgi:hypothetical protein
MKTIYILTCMFLISVFAAAQGNFEKDGLTYNKTGNY